MKISYFLHFFFFFYPSPISMPTSESAEDGDALAGVKKKEVETNEKKIVRVVGTGRRRATTSGTFSPSVTNDAVFST